MPLQVIESVGVEYDRISPDDHSSSITEEMSLVSDMLERGIGIIWSVDENPKIYLALVLKQCMLYVVHSNVEVELRTIIVDL